MSAAPSADRPAVVPLAALEGFAARLLAALGQPDDEAAIVARCLVAAHERGFDTHGVGCLPAYAACLREGRINPRPRVRIERRMPWAAIVHGDNGMGHLLATRAMEAVLESCCALGIGGAVIRHGNHFGAACLYPMMALAEGCVGIAMANAARTLAPWGSREPLLGTNPLAVAVPAGRHPPLVIDLATATAARRKIRDAADRGATIPEGWALDKDGRPTTDGRAALAGVLLPFGGAKGSAIAMLIDILSGVLAGAAFGGDVLSFHENTKRHALTGGFFLAFRVEAFMPLAEFQARMDELIDRIHGLQPADGFDRVRVPGERGAALTAARRAEGVPIEARLADDLDRLGRGLGVAFPR